MSAKACSTGSALPALKDDTLRLYSMRFCPYAERTRLVLAHFNVPHEVVNINLKAKPAWFFEKNPLGLVPVLEKGGKIVYESSICDEYIDEVYGKQALLSTDSYERAQQKILMERFSKVTSAFYGILLKSGDEKKEAVENIHKALDIFEQLLEGKFFAGDSVKMIDYHIWPWFERIPMAKELSDVDILPASRFPKLTAWVARMRELPAVKEAEFSTKLHVEFLGRGYLKGEMPDYDIGLE